MLDIIEVGDHTAMEVRFPVDPGSALLPPDPDRARRAVRQLIGTEPCKRSRFGELVQVIREAPSEVVPDLLDALRVVSDPEASNLIESLVTELGGPFIARIIELAVDPGQPLLFRQRLARVAADVEGVGEGRRTEVLLRLMGDAEPQLRAAAVEAVGLSELRVPDLVARLRQLHDKDEDSWVRECAAEALEELDL